jgi:hypothetical protein
MRRSDRLAVLSMFGLALSALTTHADDDVAEAFLKRFFEGHTVVVRVDMPATTGGIDVYPERENPLDYATAADHLRASGVAVREGDRITVTRVKVKDDLIEFQLGGGGFSVFKDTSGTVSIPTKGKSSLERDLERDLSNETDPHRRRQLQHEIDDLRHEREAENARNQAIAEATNEERRERDRQRALEMGSRFNVRFDKKDVPAAYLTPEGVMRALARYVDFRGLGPAPPSRPEDLQLERPGSGAPPAGPTDADAVRKGMTRAEVEALCGRPLREDQSREGALTVHVASYREGAHRIEVTFVDDVVVSVTTLRQ